ncbi:MAG: DsbA family protein, partial [Phycisphaerales bacterium]|nr:DsbA family protein [Hyphomonadaceae bacterium]
GATIHKGDGATTVFAINFVFRDANQIEVILRDDATGEETTLTPTSNYTITGGGGSAGSVKMRVAPAQGKTIIIRERAKSAAAAAGATGLAAPMVQIGIAAAAAVVVIGALLWFFAFTPDETPVTPQATTLTQYNPAKDDLVEGNKDAPIVMIEYASLGCPHCAEFAEHELPQIKTNYIDKGLVFLIMRRYPHTPPSMGATLVASCLPIEEQKDFMDVLFRTQALWAFDQKYEENLVTVARRAGMTREKAEQCMKNDALFASIRADQEVASKELGITGIPTFFVNGRKVGPGPYREFEQLFESILTQLNHPGAKPKAAAPAPTTPAPAGATSPAPSTTPESSTAPATPPAGETAQPPASPQTPPTTPPESDTTAPQN